MKKKMRKHLFKKSFVTLLAVSVLSTSISITAFAEEENTSEEPAVVAEVAPAEEPTITTETTYTSESDTAGENPYGADLPIINGEDLEDAPGSEPSDNVVWWYELEDYIEETDKAEEVPVENTKETNPEYPITVNFSYAYIIDDIFDNLAERFSFTPEQLEGTVPSAKAYPHGGLETDVLIKNMGKGFGFIGFIIPHPVYGDIVYDMGSDKDYFGVIPNDMDIYEGMEVIVVYRYSGETSQTPPRNETNSEYPITVNFSYAYITDKYFDNLAERFSFTPEQLEGTVPSANAYPHGGLETDVLIKNMGKGFGFIGFIIPHPVYGDIVYDMGSDKDYFGVIPNDMDIYEGMEIIVVYRYSGETSDVTPEATPDVTPEVTPDVTPETTPDVTPEVTPDVTPEATPNVTPDVTLDVTPDVTPVTSTSIVVETGTFPPMVEEVDAPAFVFPTLLEAAGEIMELIPDEELPLANIELKKTETPMGHIHMDPHLCNILSLLLLLAVAFVVYSYTQMAKKHEERIYELKLGYRY